MLSRGLFRQLGARSSAHSKPSTIMNCLTITKIWRWTMGKLFSKRKPECELKPEEVAAIRDVWIKAKNDDVGKKILATLIERRPKFAEYFGIASENVSVKELYTNRQFQLQAHRIQGFLDTAVGSLGYCPLTSIHDMAHRIGQIHFYRGVNFGADNWLVFKKVAVDQVTSVKIQSKSASSVDLDERELAAAAPAEIDPNNPFAPDNCIARVGWNKLMAVIVREMKRGFLEEAMRNCKEEDVDNPLAG